MIGQVSLQPAPSPYKHLAQNGYLHCLGIAYVAQLRGIVSVS